MPPPAIASVRDMGGFCPPRGTPPSRPLLRGSSRVRVGREQHLEQPRFRGFGDAAANGALELLAKVFADAARDLGTFAQQVDVWRVRRRLHETRDAVGQLDRG